jgi:hypothetical protein
MMRREVEDEGRKNQGRGKGRMVMGSLVLSIVGRNLLMERGSGDCNLHGGGNGDGNGKGGGMDEKLADCQRATERGEIRGPQEKMPFFSNCSWTNFE